MGHTILLYSIIFTFAGLAVAVSGKCFFNSKIMCMFGAVITTIDFGMCISLLTIGLIIVVIDMVKGE